MNYYPLSLQNYKKIATSPHVFGKNNPFLIINNVYQPLDSI